MKFVALALAAGAVAPACAQYSAPLDPLWFNEPVNMEAGYTWDDNVERSRQPDPRHGDGIFGFGASYSRNTLLHPNVRGEVTLLMSGERFARFTGLSRASGGIQAALEYRASGAFDEPTFGLTARAVYDHFDSRLRRGPHYFAGLNVQRPLTDRIDIYAEAGTNIRRGHSDVFNGRDYAAKVNLGYAIVAFGTLYATAEYRKGDTVSIGGPSLVNVDLAKVFVPDDAFEGQFAYRMNARTALATLGWNYPLGPRGAIDLSWRRVQSTPVDRPGFDAGPLRYIDNQYSITYLRRF